MTVSSTTRSSTHLCNGATTVFTTGYRVLAADEVRAFLLDASTDEVSSELTYPTDFTVSDVGASSATVTTATAYSSSYKLRTLRSTARAQESDLIDGDSFPAETVETAFDRLTFIAQEIDGAVERTLRVPEGEVLSEIPSSASRASKLLGFTSTGALTVTAPTSGSAADLALDLASTTAATEGAGQVGFAYALDYATGTVGQAIQGQQISLYWFLTEAQIDDATSGAAPLVDSQAAWDTAWDYIKTRGGTLHIPPGNYLWNAQVTFDFTSPVTIDVRGYGTRIYTGASVTGAALKCSGAYNEFPQQIQGLVFDARGNANVGGAIDVVGCHNLDIHHCSMEFYGTKAGCYFVHLYSIYSFGGSPPSGTTDDWNSFWCTVRDCTTRKRSGAEAGTLTYGIKMTGAVNAFTTEKNTFTHCDYCIYATGEPTVAGKTLANAVLHENNFFETCSTAVHIQMTAGQLGPTGWRLAFNRTEATTTFFSLATGGAAATNHSQPPFLIGNYCTSGSVTNWVLNPTSYPVSALESRYPGFGPTVDNELWQAGSLRLRFDAGKDMYLLDSSGSNDYNRAKFILGSYALWLNNSNGKLYLRSGQPTTGTDGTVVGTQT